MELPYHVHRVKTGSLGEGNWDDSAWDKAQSLTIGSFHPKSSDHRPQAQARLLYDDAHLYVRYDVNDRYVLSKATEYQQMVCLDSCIEFFARPKAGAGYFNFETNCGGTLLLYYIEDPTRTPTGFVKYMRVDPKLAQKILIFHSLPQTVFPERTEPTDWRVGCRIPFALFEHYVGPLGQISGSAWQGNFYKCADNSSHPHWASWSSFGEKLNFHQPDSFGAIRFE